MSSYLPPIKSDYENPFKVPPDEEILNIKEIKAREKQERDRKRKQKIWEKGVKFNRKGALREIEEIQPKTEEKVTVAEAAQMAAITDRMRSKDNMHKTIEKKREMFLLQMAIDNKKEEIKKLEKFALLREYGLKNSEDMLIEDMNRFNEYWDECKRESHDAIKEAKKLNKAKIDITHETNRLNEEIQHLQAQIQKHEESLEEYNNYKEFLSKVAPQESQDTMYFQDSEQLMEIFHGFIEENLFLIQNIQELEQSLEQGKHELNNLQSSSENKLKELKDSRDELQRSIEEKNKRCSILEVRLAKTQEQEKVGNPILATLDETIKDALGAENENTQQTSLEMLGDIEYRLNNYLRVFEELNQDYMREKATELEKYRREQARNETIAKEKEENQKRLQKYMERSANPKAQKAGRPSMAKSRIIEKPKKQVRVQTPQEDRDRKEFLEED